MPHRPALLDDAERALADGDWATARDAFAAALEISESAEALAGLGEALWWLGEVPTAVEYGERAYAAYRHRGDQAAATDLALWLALRHYTNLGNEAAASGWLARARTLVDDYGIEALRGWVLLYEAETVGLDEGEALARQALDLARKAEDRSLELCALSEIGARLVALGNIGEGMRHVDQAMAASLAGEGGTPFAAVYANCKTLASCTSCAAFERAVQWIRAADQFVRRFGCPFMSARCRTLYGAVLTAVGDWVQAEEELQTAVRLSRHAMPAVHTDALAGLASLRLAYGSIEEAERLVEGLHDRAATAPVVARIQLLRGEPASAETTLRCWMAEPDTVSVNDLVLHELLGEAELAQGRAPQAAERGRALAAVGERLDYDVATAIGMRLYGRALAHTAGVDEVRPQFDRAVALFARLGMPLEVARTRRLLGRVLAAQEPQAAAAELRRALEAFDALGAARDADEAAGLLRDLGVVPVRPGLKGPAPLSAREQQVLALLGEGLSNPAIADRLYISRRTVEHHVGRILDKLGLHTRGEAIAQAVRYGIASDDVHRPERRLT
ncbi:MAG: LuxR C-terminal-related transcriptional regulator [Actinomycetota bacterium]